MNINIEKLKLTPSTKDAVLLILKDTAELIKSGKDDAGFLLTTKEGVCCEITGYNMSNDNIAMSIFTLLNERPEIKLMLSLLLMEQTLEGKQDE